MVRLLSSGKSIFAALLAGCVVCAHAAPQAFPIKISPGPNPPEAKRIANYPDAIGAIVWVIVNKLGLPAPRGTLEVHATRESFERALVEHLKITPVLAQSTAQFAKSAVGGHTVLVNAPAVADSTWPQRIELLAHELAHCEQLTLANRPALSRPQWLIEGYAEWIAFKVTDALGLDNLAGARQRKIAKLRKLRRERELPKLVLIVSFSEWVEARQTYGFDGTYSLAFLATDFLIRRHSPLDAADYFRRFEHSDDDAANFHAAFGEDLGNFEHALDRHLDSLLR